MKLAFGKEMIDLCLPGDLQVDVALPRPVQALSRPEEAVKAALRKPIREKPLKEMVSAGDKVAVLVNDPTRLARSEVFLPILIAELNDAGIPDCDISLIFATGSHRAVTPEEMEATAGPDLSRRLSMYNHDSRDDTNLVYKGQTWRGTPVWVNKQVAEADRRILTGSIIYHYFAGFGGGRKALIPGTAGYETISANHRLMLQPGSRLGLLAGNPVHEDMLQAAKMIGCDFLLNTVLNEEKEIVGVYAGDMEAAHLEGCRQVEKLFSTPLAAPYDLVIVSCGGHPKDINFYQAHKALENAVLALRTGGILLLLADCPEEIGSDMLEKWLSRYPRAEQMQKEMETNFQLGAHKAFALRRIQQKARVYIYTGMPEETVRRVHFTPVTTLREGLEKVLAACGPEPRVLVLPQGGLTVPLLQ